MQTKFPIWQSRLPIQLGVPIEWIRAARASLKEGQDWARVGNRIAYSQKAVDRLRASLDLEKARAMAPPIEPNPPEGIWIPPAVKSPPKPAQRPLVVYHLPPINRRLVCVYFQGDTPPQTISACAIMRVRDNREFKINTIIQPDSYETREPNLFDWVGRQPPQR